MATNNVHETCWQVREVYLSQQGFTTLVCDTRPQRSSFQYVALSAIVQSPHNPCSSGAQMGKKAIVQCIGAKEGKLVV
jgi:hypothetical protein